MSVRFYQKRLNLRSGINPWTTNPGLAIQRSHLYPDHHVEVPLRVLLDDVAHVVRLARHLELAARHEVLDLADRPDRVLVRLRQAATVQAGAVKLRNFGQ